MNKQFSFSIKVNGSIGKYSFSAPVENGYVFTNYFCPNSLLQGEGNFLSQNAIPQQGETEDEFVQDCQYIVNKSNTIPTEDTFTSLGQGLMHIVCNHLDIYGRILFMDLLIYMDCFAYLLKATGFSETEIKRVYPIVTKQIVDAAIQYVKDSHTLLPFHATKYYKILCKLAAQ